MRSTVDTLRTVTNDRTELAMVMKWPKARYEQTVRLGGAVGALHGYTLFMLIIRNCLEKLRNLNDGPPGLSFGSYPRRSINRAHQKYPLKKTVAEVKVTTSNNSTAAPAGMTLAQIGPQLERAQRSSY